MPVIPTTFGGYDLPPIPKPNPQYITKDWE